MDFDDIGGEPTQKLARIEKERRFAPKPLPNTQEISQGGPHALKKIQLLPLADESPTPSLPKLEFFSTPPTLMGITPPPALSTDLWGENISLAHSDEIPASTTIKLNETTEESQDVSAPESVFSPFERQPKTTLPLELDSSLDQAWEDENTFSEMVNEDRAEYDYAIAASDDLPVFEELDLFDIDAVLDQQAADAQQQEYEREKERAAKENWLEKWSGSLSLIYVNWDNAETAEQDALRRLGYADIRLSKETRDFIIQAARNARLPHKQEVQLTTRLAECKRQLLRLPVYDEDVVDPYAARRHALQTEITEIEQTLVSKMQWVAIKKAVQFLGQGIELDDLIQIGMLGVISGVRHFDITRGARLLHAVNMWVFQSLSRAIGDYGSAIRLPMYIFEQIKNLQKQRAQWELSHVNPPTRQELAEVMELSSVQLETILRAEELLNASNNAFSLENYALIENANDGYSFQIPEVDFTANNDLVLDLIEEVDGQAMQSVLFQRLSLREKQVFSLRTGLNGDEEEYTLEEIGRALGVTRERIRQIEERARRKLTFRVRFMYPVLATSQEAEKRTEKPSNSKNVQEQSKSVRKAVPSVRMTKKRVEKIKRELAEQGGREAKSG